MENKQGMIDSIDFLDLDAILEQEIAKNPDFCKNPPRRTKQEEIDHNLACQHFEKILTKNGIKVY